jgi:hypothetical protein
MSGSPFQVPFVTNTQVNSSNLGGPFRGFSPQQTVNMFKDSEQTMIRGVLRRSWNNTNAQGSINNKGRVVTPFRAVNNLGDYLGRQQYVCGGSNQVNKTFPGRQGPMGSIISHCDNTRIAASVANNRFVPDSSDYTTYRKQKAIVQNYNDLANGGDKSNASYVAWMHVRSF